MDSILSVLGEAVRIAFPIGFVLALVPGGVYLERRLSAFMQGRLGPNRVDLPLIGRLGGILPGGLGQGIADAIKMMFKESVVPRGADKLLFIGGPLLVMLPPLMGFVVIPYGNQIHGTHLQVANLGIGVLFTMSVLSVAVYGLAFGGWASNNKYSLLGGLRASAQLISYELTLGLSIMTVLMFAGSVDPHAIIRKQIDGPFVFGWNIFGGGNPWLLPSGLVAFVLFFVAALAENNRLPFDLPECEAELVGGYHTEYSGLKFAMFMLGEYAGMILMSSLLVTFFLGGWHFPGITDPQGTGWIDGLLSVAVFSAKVLSILLVYIWVRWTLPRFKYNQLMDLGWKRLVPISLANVLVVATVGVLTSGGGR